MNARITTIRGLRPSSRSGWGSIWPVFRRLAIWARLVLGSTESSISIFLSLSTQDILVRFRGTPARLEDAVRGLSRGGDGACL